MTSDKANAPGDEAGGAEDERPGGRNVTPTVPRRRRDWRAVWEPLQRQAQEKAQYRRGRVLAHPDLAQRLTAPPIGYARPDQWNGYVPPTMWGYAQSPRDRSAGRELRNDSPRRAALVELAAEALQREQGSAEA